MPTHTERNIDYDQTHGTTTIEQVSIYHWQSEVPHQGALVGTWESCDPYTDLQGIWKISGNNTEARSRRSRTHPRT